jgi:hypothetical protein
VAGEDEGVLGHLSGLRPQQQQPADLEVSELSALLGQERIRGLPHLIVGELEALLPRLRSERMHRVDEPLLDRDPKRGEGLRRSQLGERAEQIEVERRADAGG